MPARLQSETTTPRGREATVRNAHSQLIHAFRPPGLEVPAVSTGHEEHQPPFSAGLSRWRERRDLSKKRLAAPMGFGASYLSHVEAGRMTPASRSPAGQRGLGCCGELAAAWKRDPGSAGDDLPAPDSLVVEDDHAELSYDGSYFRASQRRRLRNTGTEPITRYLMRIGWTAIPATRNCPTPTTASTR